MPLETSNLAKSKVCELPSSIVRLLKGVNRLAESAQPENGRQRRLFSVTAMLEPAESELKSNDAALAAGTTRNEALERDRI